MAAACPPAASTLSACRMAICNGFVMPSPNEAPFVKVKSEIIGAMDMTAHLASHFDDAVDTFKASARELTEPLAVAVELLFGALANNCKILSCGNGGSAADAQHFIAELVGRFERDRLPLAGIALNTDTSILTAVGNDYGFDAVFERQVNALGQPGDVLVAISTSGNSPNVLRSIEAAHDREMSIIAVSGKGGGKINELLYETDVHLCVPHDRTMRIQEVHILLLHALCDGIDALLLGEDRKSTRLNS